MSEQPFSPGLEGVIAGETSVCEVTQEGLRYRGYAIEGLADKCCFEEVAHLLIYGALPTSAQLAQFREMLATFRQLPHEVSELLHTIPTNVSLMDVLRTSVSMCGHFDPVSGDTPDDVRRRAVWLTAVIASIITARLCFVYRKPPLEPKAGLSHAAQILYQVQGEVPPERTEKLLDLVLILYAEHGYNTGTFANRVICSTKSDQVSAVVGAIGSVKGRLHGGGAEQALAMLERFENAAQASHWVQDALERKEAIVGFGHRIHWQGDPRAVILEAEMRKLAQEKNMNRLVEIYDAIKTSLANQEDPICPTVDYPCGLTYHLMGLPPELYAPLSVSSRVTGWSAHYLEQQTNDRLIRPLSRYIGPVEREVSPIERR